MCNIRSSPTWNKAPMGFKTPEHSRHLQDFCSNRNGSEWFGGACQGSWVRIAQRTLGCFIVQSDRVDNFL